jgi:hypothetical protein
MSDRSNRTGDGPRPPRRVQPRGHADVTVDVDIADVWAVVSDPTRVDEWSHETVAAEWLGDHSDAVPGARFRGRNRAGVFRWGRVCEIVDIHPCEIVWRTVSSARFPDSTEWRIALSVADVGGTRIEQTFEVVRAPRVLSWLYALMIPAHRDRTEALREDLRRIGEVARQSATAGQATPS